MEIQLSVKTVILIGLFFYFAVQASVNGLQGTTLCKGGHYGQPASVTCVFREDIRNSSRYVGFSLVRYSHGLPDPLVLCYKFNSSWECHVSPGFEFNKSAISGNMPILIPRASAEHAGQYKCQLDPPNGATTCDLELTNMSRAVNQTSPAAREKSEKLDVCDSRHEEALRQKVILALISTLLLLALVILLTVLKKDWYIIFFEKVFCCPRNNRNRRFEGRTYFQMWNKDESHSTTAVQTETARDVSLSPRLILSQSVESFRTVGIDVRTQGINRDDDEYWNPIMWRTEDPNVMSLSA